MHRSRLLSAAAALLAATAHAQCVTPGGTAAGLGNPDEALSAPLPLGFGFPMAGAAGAPFTHCVVSSNGVVYLTNGGAAADASAVQHGSVAELQGAVGASPRLAPFWSDLWDAFYVGAAWSVDVDTSVPGRCAVVWTDCCEWPQDAPALTFEVELFATGVVTFAYGNFATDSFFLDAVVGLSLGDAVADPGGVDLTSFPLAVSDIGYEVFAPGAFDLANRAISFTPNGTGYDVATTCQDPPASHTRLGVGCYTHSDSFYQSFADAAAASIALSGQSMTLMPTANGYAVTWGGGTFEPPTAPVTLMLADDGDVTYTPSMPFPTPHGPAAVLNVHANAIVSMSAAAPTFVGTTGYQPTAAAMLDADVTAFWSWHDYNVDEGGSGVITVEEKVQGADTILYLTWNGVESYADPEAANPSTLQFQFHLTTGAVVYVWQSIDDDVSSSFGSAHLIGWSPAGVSPDGGSFDLATALPIATSVATFPLRLEASPAAISTATTGTTLDFTTSGIPEALPSSGVYLGMHILSFGVLPGIDLDNFGAPGCPLYVASFDIVSGMVGATPELSIRFFVPPGVAPATTVWSQSVALVGPFSLPYGENALGVTTSNGLQTRIQPF